MKINDWSSLEPLDVSEELVFTTPGGPRHVRIAGIANRQTEAWLVDEEGQTRLVAVLPPGDLELTFYIRGTTVLKLVPQDDGVVYVRSFAKSHVVAKTTSEVFTTIATRAARNPQLEAILYQLKQNEQARQATLTRELGRIAEMEARLAASEKPAPVEGLAPVEQPAGVDEGVAEPSAAPAGGGA